MHIFDKMKKICRPFRIILGLALIITAVITAIPWFYLGVLPFIAGIANFCPACIISKKCST